MSKMNSLKTTGKRTNAIVYRIHNRAHIEPSAYSSYTEIIDVPVLTVEFTSARGVVRLRPDRNLVELPKLYPFKPDGVAPLPNDGRPAHVLRTNVRYLEDDVRTFTVEGYERESLPLRFWIASIALIGRTCGLLYAGGRFFWPLLLAPLMFAFIGIPGSEAPGDLMRWKPSDDGVGVAILCIPLVAFGFMAYLILAFT